MMFRKTQGKRWFEIRERRGAERRRAKGGRFALQASSAGIRPGEALRGEGGRGGTRRSESRASRVEASRGPARKPSWGPKEPRPANHRGEKEAESQ